LSLQTLSFKILVLYLVLSNSSGSLGLFISFSGRFYIAGDLRLLYVEIFVGVAYSNNFDSLTLACQTEINLLAFLTALLIPTILIH